MQGVKKFFNMQKVLYRVPSSFCVNPCKTYRPRYLTFAFILFLLQEDEKLVDPYVLFQFCGKEVRYNYSNK